MPFSIIRSSIASVSTEAVFCPAKDFSELRRTVLRLAGISYGDGSVPLRSSLTSHPVITDSPWSVQYVMSVEYPPSSVFEADFRDAFSHLSAREVQKVLIPLETESQLHPIVTLVRDYLMHEDESDMEITILLRDRPLPRHKAAEQRDFFAGVQTSDAPAAMPDASSEPFSDMDMLFTGAMSAMPCSIEPPLRSIQARQAKESEITKLVRDFRRFPNPGESFHDMLFRLIDETGLSDVEIYKRANISRQLFSKIRSNRNYQPGKNTVFAFAFALHLTEGETVLLLESAGFAFSPSSPTDRAVRMCMQQDVYDIGDVNEFLFQLDLRGLGA